MESNIILYTTENGSISVQLQFEDGTFWLSQKRMAELFGVEVPTINYHLKEIFKSGELEEVSVIRKIRITADDGKKYLTNFYHLKVILAVGYHCDGTLRCRVRGPLPYLPESSLESCPLSIAIVANVLRNLCVLSHAVGKIA